MQRRLSLFIGLMFSSYIALIVFINVMYALYPVTRPARADIINVFAAGGMVLLGWGWWVSSSRKLRSARMIFGLDVAAVLIISAAFATSGLLSSDRPANIYSSFIWMSFTIFARSLIVPSSGKRSAVLSALGVAPMFGISFAVTVDTPTAPFAAGTGIFCLVVAILAAVGSHVIYGLRAQVKEAMQLGQYTILEKIGEGGMGTVYKARHAMLRRPTAIKLLRADRAGVDSLKRFEREVQSTADLTHPNIIAIYDYGRSPEGVFYYAMELLHGVDLENLIRHTGALPWQRVAHILEQTCGALADAHGHGLIHRDIKPGNIMLCERGGIYDVAKVLDFGLVREIDDADRLTQADVVSGTPAYLAPEAITHPDDVGAAADLYAVGAVGYYLLTGHMVFEGNTPIEVCMRHVDATPTPLRRRTDKEIPDALEQVIMRCLDKDPTARPDAITMRRALLQLRISDYWTEDQARDAWTELSTVHATLLAGSSPSSLATMNVDVASRTLVDAIGAIEAEHERANEASRPPVN